MISLARAIASATCRRGGALVQCSKLAENRDFGAFYDEWRSYVLVDRHN